MKILGLITEYNPFHNGHLYHLEESKKITGCDYTVCIMSGNFIQRGEPALIDKWSRAKMALKSGIDLVLELPVLYSLQTAELFAFGSIKTLDSLGVIDSICFGSECGDISVLDEISSALVSEPDEYKLFLKEFLSYGVTFPQARAKALSKYFECIKQVKTIYLEKILNSSNNILGIEYLKALKRINSKIHPFTINRIKNDYNSTQINSNITSATSIRHSLYNYDDITLIKETLPDSTYKILVEEFANGKGPVFSNAFENMILAEIRKMDIEEISKTFDVGEGLEHKIKKASIKASSIQDLIDAIKSKRYTQTRIQRILYHILLGIKKELYIELSQYGGPQYIRVLGFNDKGKQILAHAKKHATLPILTKLSNHLCSDNSIMRKMLQYDILSTNIYTLGYTNSKFRIANLDYTHGIVIEK